MEQNIIHDDELVYDILKDNMKQSLAFDIDRDYGTWREAVRTKFCELMGMECIEANEAPDLNINIESKEKKDGYTRIRFTFESEIGTRVPCYLLIPDMGKEKYPVAITLQGHSTGFHNSVGDVKFERDVKYQPRGAFGLQAVENGYIALCVEQRGMGERRPKKPNRGGFNCDYTAYRALLLGRTLLGERIFDIKRAIDTLAYFSECDMEKIFITGNSGGGTAAYYAACYDERIKLTVPSCAFCTYKSSILDVFHCSCNYIPSAYRYFEMQDLSTLIAPRNIAVIAGEKDEIFPIEGVKEAYKTLSHIYKKAGAEDKCRLVVTPREHWWCADIVWSVINEETKKLGW